MGPLETPTPTIVEPDIDETVDVARPWVVIVWNDPVNLMSYVVYVFQKLFGYSRPKATKLMLDVHHKGRAAVSHGTREKAEFDVARLHAHGLWATIAASAGRAAATSSCGCRGRNATSSAASRNSCATSWRATTRSSSACSR